MARTYHHGKNKRRTFGVNLLEITAPSWWIRQKMTRPKRVETRETLSLIHKVIDIENPPLFPLARKPKIYYW